MPPYDPDPFDVPVSSASGGDFTPCPAGMIPGVLSQLYFVGHQFKQYDDGGERWVPTLVAVVEVASTVATKSDGAPFLFALEFNNALKKGSKLRETLESLAGKTLVDDSRVSLRDFLGLCCLLEIVHKSGTTRRGNAGTFANCKGMRGYPAGMPMVDPRLPVHAWSITSGQPLPEYHASLPRFYGATLEDYVRESWEAKHPGEPIPEPVYGKKSPAPTAAASAHPTPLAAPWQSPASAAVVPVQSVAPAPPAAPQPAAASPPWAPQYVPEKSRPAPANFGNLPPTPVGPNPVGPAGAALPY